MVERSLVSETEARPEEVSAPETEETRYPSGRVHSPLTSDLVHRLRELRLAGAERQEAVFMKVGASETVNRQYLRCFWGDEHATSIINLGDHEALRETLEHFQAGRTPGGRSPFIRDSEAAKVGRATAWAYTGTPSPLAREIRATNPAWALVSFGTNDLGVGRSPEVSLQNYFQRLSHLADLILDENIVPLLLGTGPRADSPQASVWTVAYSLVTRAVAEARQVPFLDLIEATRSLPGLGLVRDGVHGNGYVDARRGRQPCVLTDEALRFHYNLRNLVTLEALDRVRRALSDDEDVLESPPLPPLAGDGTVRSPFPIDQLPFTQQSSTAGAPSNELVDYHGCSGALPQGGPERIFQLRLEEARSLRLIALSAEGVDVDLHLLGEEVSDESCLARDTRMLAGVLQPGTYHVVVDTFTDRRNRQRPGQFLLLVLDCDAREPDCEAPLR